MNASGGSDEGGWQTVHYGRQHKKNSNRPREESRANPEREAAEGQDWNRVVIRKKASTGPRPKGANSLRGQIKEAVKDVTGESSGRLKKLEELGHASKRRQLDEASLKTIRDVRFGMALTQDEVNHMCQFPKHLFRDIESGAYCPNPKQLDVLSSVLKVSLRYAH